MRHNSPVNFKLKYVQLWTKESHQKFAKFFMLFSKPKLVFLQILDHSLVSWKIIPLHFVRSNITTKNQSKCEFLGLLSARIILVIFETTNQFSFKFVYQSWVPSNITSLYFQSWSIIYFGRRQPIKVQIFEIFECSLQNLLNFSSQFWTSQFLFKFCIFLDCHNT